MSWTNTMMVRLIVEPKESASPEARVANEAPSTGWDPYEIWVTRIKQPREAAASSSKGTSNFARGSFSLRARTPRSDSHEPANPGIPAPASLMNRYGLDDPCMEPNAA